MPNDTNESQICECFVRHSTIECKSGVSTTQAEANAASSTFRGKKIKEQTRLADEQSRAPSTKVGKDAAVMNEDEEKNGENTMLFNRTLGMAFVTKPKKEVRIDTTKYQAYLDDEDLTDEQKEQLLETLFKFMICFVDLGYGISPLQQACGQLAESVDSSGASDPDLLEYEATTLSETFNLHAAE